ncbi:MAG: hypothetical protein HQ567_21455 [Candidatus Nealsonbacteria bacterium]|nr:hypothetical protein [Candidatus Nealsonbacteria bacterium]
MLDWDVRTWDLSADFYHQNSTQPTLKEILSASVDHDCASLDKLYFAWEDSLRTATTVGRHGILCGLLSGYSFPELCRIMHLRDVMHPIRTDGTVFTRYYEESVVPALMAERPTVVAISISSSHQIVPSLELMALIRQHIPEAFLLLGGNVVTRLRDSSCLELLLSLSDQLALFQGEVGFCHVLQTITDVGVGRARQDLPKIAGDQQIPWEQWPTPSFAGIRFERICGLPVLPYVSTRGCYWGRCHFCGIPAGWALSGYGGSAPMSFAVEQLQRMVEETGVSRIKFVDESMSPSKARDACQVLARSRLHLEWEAYARLEPAWENAALLEELYSCGLRKLYFGLEQAPSASRDLMNKRDGGNPLRILSACHQTRIAAHLFCMVGYPGTSREDAELTTRFLLDNQHLIDTADLVGFRLDRGTNVPGVRPGIEEARDWALALPYESIGDGMLSSSEVAELENVCQEALWQEAPHLLHPLYRLVTPWANARVSGESDTRDSQGICACLASS